MEPWPRQAFIWTLLVVTALLAMLGPLWRPLGCYDEGFEVLNALRILQGEVPGRDFWALYPPGQSYLGALVFWLCGPNVMAARLAGCLVHWVCLGLAVRLVLDMASWPQAIWVGFVTLIIFGSVGPTYSVAPAFALALGALLASRKALASGRLGWLAVSGFLAGMMTVFRLDMGLLFLAVLVLSVAAVQALEFSPTTKVLRMLFRRAGLSAGAVTAGALAVMAPVYGVLVARVGFGTLWSQWFDFPLHHFRQVRGLPLPPLVPLLDLRENLAVWGGCYELARNWLCFYCPIAVFLGAFVWLGWRLWRGERLPRPWAFTVLSCSLFGLGLMGRACSRFDHSHVAPMMVMGALVLAFAYAAHSFCLARRARVLTAVALVLEIVPLPVELGGGSLVG